MLNTITLPNAGTYIIGGQNTFYNSDSTNASEVDCYVYGPDSSGGTIVLNTVGPSYADVGADHGFATIPFNGYFVAPSAGSQLQLECENLGNSMSLYSTGGALTAIQVQ